MSITNSLSEEAPSFPSKPISCAATTVLKIVTCVAWENIPNVIIIPWVLPAPIPSVLTRYVLLTTVCGVPIAVMNGPCHIHMALQMLHVQAPIYPPFSDFLACCCVSSLLDSPYNFVNFSLCGLLVLVEVGPP